MIESEKVYWLRGRGLGDCIGGIMIYLDYSVKQNKIIRVANGYVKNGRKRNLKHKMDDILPLIDSPGKILQVDETPIATYLDGEETKIKYFRTNPYWKPNNNNMVAYQFDGRSHKNKNFPSKDAENEVLDFVVERKFGVIQLGQHISLRECVSILSQAAIFVGVPSGMAVLSWAVGTPTYIIFNKLDSTWLASHKSSHFLLLHTGKDFIDAFSEYYKNGIDIYKKKCINPECLL